MTAQELIAENKITKNISLDLSNCDLTELPEELMDCIWLEKLYFSYNQISDISALKELKSLKYLEFSNNQVSDILVLVELKNLDKLYFSNNQVSDISVLKELKNLSDLDFSNNQITEFPYFLKNLSYIVEINFLPNLYQFESKYISDFISKNPDLDFNNIPSFKLICEIIEKETQQKTDQSEWIDLKIPKYFERVVSQYFLLFKDFVSVIKGRTIDFYLRHQGDYLYLISNGDTNISREQIEIYLDEYVALITKNLENPVFTVENRELTERLSNEYDIFLLELKNEIRNLKNNMEILILKNDFLNKEIKGKNRQINFLQETLQLILGKRKEKVDYEQILDDLKNKLVRMAERKHTKKIEDLHNDDLTHFLRDQKYQISDQTRSGKSNKGGGELDIMIRQINGTPVSIIEALRLKSCGKDNQIIAEHLHKLLYDYDSIGLDRNFLIVYAEANDFENLWLNYQEYIDEINGHPVFLKGTYPQIGGLKLKESRFTDLKVGVSKYKRNGETIEIYHLFVNMFVPKI